MTTSTYAVSGMTCAHCVAAVTEEIGLIPGVRQVAVDLVAGGLSTVTVDSHTDLDLVLVRDAVEEAGYRLGAATP